MGLLLTEWNTVKAVDECGGMSKRKQGTLLHLSVVAAREAMVTQHFLFVWQEGERIREQSEGSEKDFTHPDTAACTDSRLHSGRRLVLLDTFKHLNATTELDGYLDCCFSNVIASWTWCCSVFISVETNWGLISCLRQSFSVQSGYNGGHLELQQYWWPPALATLGLPGPL